MMPRLLSISGASKTSALELTGNEMSIGRDRGNWLMINDISVSRQHCLIKKEAGTFKLYDLNSHNKTYVNDKPTSEHILEHGDRIKIGNALFIFLLAEIEPISEADGVCLEENVLVTSTAFKIHTIDALSLIARDFGVFMDISMIINSISELKELQRRLLELIFEIVPADCGAILLAGDGSNEFEFVFGMERHSGQEQNVRVSLTIVRQVLHEGSAIMSSEILENDKFRTAESLISSQIQSLLSVPITLLGKALGVIYLDTKNPDTRFDRNQLQMVIAIANIAAGVLNNVSQTERLKNENQRLRAAINVQHDMVGKSQPMSEVYQLISRVAPTDLTVIISGESGTGKELVARAIHKNSRRAGKPFIAINCAAITESLLESELFGHEKGAFTDARAQKAGHLEVAQGGSVFLDEVCELSPAAQAKLLRVLQERELLRVGSTVPVKLDMRFIAATNKNIQEEVATGAFRHDLYFRLCVLPLAIPPLRERREDILLLSKHFIHKYGEKYQREIKGLSAEARAQMVNYDWPGNVRELENAIERAVALCTTEDIMVEDLRINGQTQSEPRNYSELVKDAKRRIIQEALEQTNYDYISAAKALDMHPNNLHRLIRTLHLKINK